jgi:hypothetical protein
MKYKDIFIDFIVLDVCHEAVGLLQRNRYGMVKSPLFCRLHELFPEMPYRTKTSKAT